MICNREHVISFKLLGKWINILKQSEDLLNTHYIRHDFLYKGKQTTQSVKCSEIYNSKYDMKCPGYETDQLCAQY